LAFNLVWIECSYGYNLYYLYPIIGPYNTSYPGYGQTTAQTAANAAQAPVAQTPIAANAGATAGAAVGGYIQATGVAANLAPAAQQVIPNLGSSAPQAGENSIRISIKRLKVSNS
jgi:hypothetical protein